MIKHATRTLAFSLAFLAASASAHPSLDTGVGGAPSPEVACSTQKDVERGWEVQMELLEARLAAKESPGLEVKGAIINAPFPQFVPYRKDIPARLATWTRSGAFENPEPIEGHPSTPQKR